MDPGPEHVDNAIHGVMNVQIERRGAPLRAKALALQLDDTAGLLVILDLVLLLTGHCDHLRRRLARATGVAAGSIVVHCTHSHSTPFAAGASFNQRLPLPDGGVKFTRDFREGLASGRPVDPRLSVLRIDTVDGSPLAGWVCFAAHPSVVIFDAPVSAEYPGYLTGRLERTLTGGAPVLFGVGACGDVNCVPMFGSEEDSRRLGENLAALIEPAWRSIDPVVPERFGVRQGSVDLPLDPPPAPATLDREIDEIDAFLSALDDDPTLAWAMGINVEPEWPVERKRTHFRLLRDWAVDMTAALAAGRRFPAAWRSSMAVRRAVHGDRAGAGRAQPARRDAADADRQRQRRLRGYRCGTPARRLRALHQLPNQPIGSRTPAAAVCDRRRWRAHRLGAPPHP